MYDALLSLRGWGEPEFCRATPAFLAAARFALYAERLMPMLAEMEGVQRTDIDITTIPTSKRAAQRQAQVRAGVVIGAFRALLFPEDGDG